MRLLVLVALCLLLVSAATAANDFPEVKTDKMVSPDEIFLVGTGAPDEAEVILTVEGIGDTIPRTPVDLILAIDVSTSMMFHLDYAKDLAEYIVTNLAAEFEFGQSGLIAFNANAMLLAELSPFHLELIPIIRGLMAFGNTALGDAINVAQSELTSPRHIEDNLQVILIISDGSSNRGADPLVAAQNAKASGTLIYAVGMGSPVEEQLLRAVASEPDSENFWSNPSPSEFNGIYEALHTVPTFRSARHMTVIEELDPRFDYVSGSFSIPPDTTHGRFADWSIGDLDIGEIWSVTFRVTASDTGLLPVEVLPTSRANYMNFAGGWVDVPFPQGYVHVIMGVGVEETVSDRSLEQSPFYLGPNPFRESVSISYLADGFADVRITIHDLAGRLTRTLFEGTPAAGSHTVVWNGKDTSGEWVAGGAYICRFESGPVTESRLILFLR